MSRFLRVISKAINSGRWKFSSWFSGAQFEEEQAKSGLVKGVRSGDTQLRYCMLNVFHLW